MENEKSIFNLELDAIAKNHLADTAKWARFLAIIGFIGLVLILVASIIVSASSATQDPFGDPIDRTADIAGSIIGALIVVALYFFPCYFLLKFSNKMKVAIASDDVISLNEALKNLKVTFRYIGVLTIIFLGLFLVGVLAGLAGS